MEHQYLNPSFDQRKSIKTDRFPLVLWLSITSLVAMLLTAFILIFLYRQDQLAEFEKKAGIETERVLLHITYSLDDQIHDFVRKSNGSNVLAPKDIRYLDSIIHSKLNQINESNILKIKIFDMSGKVVYSTVKKEIDTIASNTKFFSIALTGESIESLGHRDKFVATKGELRDIDVFETYLPLVHEGKQIGVIESYTNAAPFFERLQIKILEIVLIIFGAFTVLYGTLILAILKADKAVAKWQNQVEVIEALLHSMAFHDSLTNLPNRYLFKDRIRQAIAASHRSRVYSALLFLDLDNFKPLNDTHGHEAGDLLLQEAAHRINNCVREVDTVARIGGDEFAVVLNELDGDKDKSMIQASMVAEKIRLSLSEPYILKSEQDDSGMSIEHLCTVSTGVALFNGNSTFEDILKWADRAMYQAKEAGKNLVRFFDAKLE